MADKKITELTLRSNVNEDVNFPVDDGTQTYRVTADQVRDFALLTNRAPYDVLNLSVVTSVSANAMTIALKTNAGADPSSSLPVNIGFRNVTPGTGNFVTRSAIAATSIVIPSGATLGHQGGVDQFIYLIAIDNAGTVELGVIGSRYELDEGSVITSTTITSGADDWLTLYSTTGRSSKAFRVIARIRSNQSVPGTYAANSTEISLATGGARTWPDATMPKNDLTFTFSSAMGTTSNTEVWYRREKNRIVGDGYTLIGTPTSAPGLFQLPFTIDDEILSAIPYIKRFGTAFSLSAVTNNMPSTNVLLALIYNTSLIAAQFVFRLGDVGGGQGGFLFDNANGVFVSGITGVQFDFDIPIKEWRSY